MLALRLTWQRLFWTNHTALTVLNVRGELIE
jgi:hypothetical protein